jgi:hypothetical protein
LGLAIASVETMSTASGRAATGTADSASAPLRRAGPPARAFASATSSTSELTADLLLTTSARDSDLDARVSQTIEDLVASRRSRRRQRGREREATGRAADPPQERPPFHASRQSTPSGKDGAPLPDSFW